MNTTTEYKDADEAWEAGQEWIKTSSTYEKMDYMKETCTEYFFKECRLLDEMARWMTQEDFNEFFKHLCSNGMIKTPQELDYDMNN